MNNNNFYNPANLNQTQTFQEQFKIFNVNSFEDVKNFNIDYFSTFIFIDQSNNNIFLKRINNNGFQELLTFKRVENPPDQFQLLNERINNIEKKLLDRWNPENDNTNNVSRNGKQFKTTKSATISERASDANG